MGGGGRMILVEVAYYQRDSSIFAIFEAWR